MSNVLTVVYQDLNHDQLCTILKDDCAVRFRHGCLITELSNKDALLRQALEALEEYQQKGAPFMSCDRVANAIRQHLGETE